MKRKALGRGLGALIQSAEETRKADSASDSVTAIEKVPGTINTGEPFRVEISNILPNPSQPRKTFNDDTLRELAQSIKAHGLAQPVIVSPHEKEGQYVLVAGERRLRASELAGLTEIDAVVRVNLDRNKRLALAIIENIQREDLNPIEEARAYLRLMKEQGLSQSQLSETTGKSKPKISNTLRLLDLEKEIQDALVAAVISEGHGRALLAIDDPAKRRTVFKQILAEKLSVRDVEAAARETLRGQEDGIVKSKRTKSGGQRPAEIIVAENELQRALGTKVQVQLGKGGSKGTLTVHFFSSEDLTRIVSKLTKEN